MGNNSRYETEMVRSARLLAFYIFLRGLPKKIYHRFTWLLWKKKCFYMFIQHCWQIVPKINVRNVWAALSVAKIYLSRCARTFKFKDSDIKKVWSISLNLQLFFWFEKYDVIFVNIPVLRKKGAIYFHHIYDLTYPTSLFIVHFVDF